ncbi:MAG: aminodeoxychorismate/anthranilate synthase component II [Bacteroidia bacterium]|nr:aminodeoxychorismate/anthranilate synthase component II [Bacteroidia bacterium]
MAKILVIDNYDSFTYNLVQYVQRIGNHQVDVFLNDEIPIADVDQYDGIIISPGPGLPSEVRLLKPLITRYKSTKRIFGVCLGQQAIAEIFGARLQNLNNVYHGVATQIIFSNPKHYLFEGLPDAIEGGRYHSWIVENKNIPDCLKIEAVDSDGQIMALSHKVFDICSVQFHPESVLTPLGINIISNWLKKF